MRPKNCSQRAKINEKAPGADVRGQYMLEL
jgi:hypothetical protein